jgi:membrane protein DedA with SNARE-associated domain
MMDEDATAGLRGRWEAMSLHIVQSWLELHSHAPWVQGVLIILGTFVLEDAATVLAAMDVQVGRVAMAVALASLYAGIVLGDLGLYGMGRLAAKSPWAARLVPPERLRRGAAMLDPHVVKVVFVSRFLPGARLPTYTACGYFGVDFKRFALTAIVATLIWTSLLFGVSLHVGRLIMDHLGAWRWVGVAGFVLTLLLAGRLAARMQTAR